MPQSPSLTIKTALLSVSDKTGILPLAQALVDQGIRILSTGGTASALRDAGIEVTDVADVTGQVEIMDGRVKTLHPKIHGGLLGRRDIDQQVMQSQQITGIDLLVVNLYPFRETVAAPDCTLQQAIEQIDIGGPAMLRAACKNHSWVTTLTRPDDYQELIDGLPQAPDLTRRRELALQGFQMTASYDSAVSQYLQGQLEQPSATGLTPSLTLQLQQQPPALRYGENPHQQAALYTVADTPASGIVAARQWQGKALSYNNLMDADAAWQAMLAISTTAPGAAACVIVKHANPCGAACSDSIINAYKTAFQADSTSAFGGIIAINQTLDVEFARYLLDNQFAEVLLAPEVASEAFELLAAKPNMRVLTLPLKSPDDQLPDIRHISGGYLLQQPDLTTVGRDAMRVVSQLQPTEQQWQDMLFAWQLVRGVKSNAVVYARDQRSLGIGAGQMSRVDSARIAVHKAQQAGWKLDGSAMASEAFFPFRDSIDNAREAGVSSVIQPGGSMRDKEVIDAVDQQGMCMVFTDRRHFRH